MAKERIAIIGAGVVGCSIALELARRGAGPIVIDRHGDVGHGSTSASCGIVRRFYSTQTMIALAQESMEVWADWSSYLGVDDPSGFAVLERPGALFVLPGLDEQVTAQVGWMKLLGVDVDVLTAQQIKDRFPFLRTRSQHPVKRPEDPDFLTEGGHPVAGGVLERDAGYVVSPQLATHNVRVAAEAAGAEFRLGHAVRSFSRRDPPKSRFLIGLAGGGSIEADVVINAAGPHSAVVNAMAGVELPLAIRPLRREVHAVPNPVSDGEGSGGVPVVGDIDSGVYFRPEAGGRELIVGSLEPRCDQLEWIDDADDWNEAATVAGYERQVMRLMKRFPEVKLGRRRGIAALYDVTVQDWIPVLDRTDEPGYYVAVGTSGSSFKTAPLIGAIMAELVTTCEAGHDHDRNPVRMTLERTGFDLDVGFFSRLRGVHPSSSSVLG